MKTSNRIGESNPTKKSRIPLHKRYVPLWAVVLLVLAASVTVFASVTLTSFKTVTVKEPLVVTPSELTFSIFAGETVQVDFTVVDLSNTVSIPVTLLTSCTVANGMPSDASCTDLSLTIEGGASQTIAPGVNTILVVVVSSSSAVAADYVIHLSVTR